MKKIFLAIIPVFAFMMTGCFDNNNDISYTGDEWFSTTLYRAVHSQDAVITLDPALLALRFNTLLATAKSQGISIDRAAIHIIDDNTTKTINLKEYLFGYMEITEVAGSAGRKWKFTFEGNRYSTNLFDRKRLGYMIIDTDPNNLSIEARLLEELPIGQYWNITFGEEDGTPNSYRHVYSDSPNIIVFDNESNTKPYRITRAESKTSSGVWKISGLSRSYGLNNKENTQSAWEFDFFFTKTGSPSHTYGNVKGAEYKLWGEASGYPIYLMTKTYLTIEESSPVVFRANCHPEKKFEGSEYIELDADEFNDDGRPDDKAERSIRAVHSYSSSENCSSQTTIYYKGFAYDPNKSQSTTRTF